MALGSVVDHSNPTLPRRWDHAWVVYQDEAGCWQILEPLAIVAPRRVRGSRRPTRRAGTPGSHADFEYTPHFVFNRQHLWRVRAGEEEAGGPFGEYVRDREFWKGFTPSFALRVHDSIYDQALIGMSSDDLAEVKRVSFWTDVDVLRYDPRDHFDFAYIDEGWRRIEDRLATGRLQDFARSMHTLTDFYAHTLYADFAERRAEGSLEPYDPDSPIPASKLVYDFTPYSPLPGCGGTADEAANNWGGKLISGQWWRWYTTFPDELEEARDFAHRRCLPDHDAVAVDGPGRKEVHRHYDDQEYRAQFTLRRRAAVEQIHSAYEKWRSGS